MPNSPGFATSVRNADSKQTIFDDRLDLEENAAYLWAKSHAIHGDPNFQIIIGTEALPTNWSTRTKHFGDLQAATSYLSRFEKNTTAMPALRTLAVSLFHCKFTRNASEEVIAAIAGNLVSGRAWLIEFPKKRPASRFQSTLDASNLASLNADLGTNIDFAFVGDLEGEDFLRGYIPFSGGIVAGNSGMTIATGFDIGQWHLSQLQALGLPAGLLKKIEPFVSPEKSKEPLGFGGKKKADVIKAIGKLGQVPEIDSTEAGICDKAVFGKKLQEAKDLWEKFRNRALAPDYVTLPPAWQTVYFSRHFQGAFGSFSQMAYQARWDEAITALTTDPVLTGYGSRTEREAKYLRASSKPAPLQPVSKAAAAKPKGSL